MPALTEQQIEDIVEQLRSGEDLPIEYRPLLFPPLKYDNQIAAEEVNGEKDALILIVDDNEFNRDLLTDHLEHQGHDSKTAENGREALDMIREESFDLVLLDIMMPEMDGYEVLERMRDDPELRHIPVIVISAVDDKKSLIRCIEMGAEDYLFKPFDATLLRARISASLEKKQLRDHEQKYLRMLEIEQEKSEHLLLNILPEPIADRLKQNEETIADSFSDVTVMFADIVDFSSFSSKVSAIDLVGVLNDIFSELDRLVEAHNLEKIKTIGDEYMVVGGLPNPLEDHAEKVARLALDIQHTISAFERESGDQFEMRIGIHSGPVVAGVIGSKKFIYDLWGDTVNTASRMQTRGLPGEIQVTETTYQLLSDKFTFEERGNVEIKGKGMMTAYLLKGVAE